MDIKVQNYKGEDQGRSVSLSDDVFGIKPNDHCIYLDVKQYLANQRQGTHKSKERAEISGSTKKIKKQKGTGTARSGSIKSGVMRGGGRMFGPRPRDYSFKLNQKVKVLARTSAFVYKLKDEAVTVLEDFTLEPKTKFYAEMLKNVSAENKKTLLIIPNVDKNVVLGARNLKKAKVVTPELLNTYDLMNCEQVLLTEGSIEKLEKILTR